MCWKAVRLIAWYYAGLVGTDKLESELSTVECPVGVLGFFSWEPEFFNVKTLNY